MEKIKKSFSTDHRFSESESKAFAEMGEFQFINPISSYPWGGRSGKVARIRIFEKYLQTDDIFEALWRQRTALNQWDKKTPMHIITDIGIVHLNKIMDERSNNGFRLEIDNLARSLPTAWEYQVEAHQLPVMSKNSINKMHIVELMQPKNV